MPAALKELCKIVLNQSRRGEWINNYDLIIEHFDKDAGIIAAEDKWENLSQVTNFLHSLTKITIANIDHLVGYHQPSDNIVWSFLRYLGGLLSRAYR